MKYFLLISILLLSELLASSKSAVVFTYHRFGNAKYPSTNITMEQFASQLKYLDEHNYTVVPLSQIIHYIQSKKEFPKNTVALTMDDAYLSVYTHAYPLLKKYNYPATVFINSNPIDYKSKRYMSWEMMQEMQKNGIEFANHSKSHPKLIKETNESFTEWKKRITDEIVLSQKRIQKHLGIHTNTNPKMFSYPFGEFDMDVLKLVKELGYVGVTQLSGAINKDTNLTTIPRFPMSQKFATKSGFKTKLHTTPFVIESVSPKDVVIIQNNPPKLRVTLKKELTRVGCFLSNGERLDIDWKSKTEFEIQAPQKLRPPRDRYTCTAPTKDGDWYWYSHLWIIK